MGIAQELTIPHLKKQHVKKCYTEHKTWIDGHEILHFDCLVSACQVIGNGSEDKFVGMQEWKIKA